MSANGATVQGESYVYGGVLFQRVAEADVEERSQRTGIAACLAQGLFTGAVLMFLLGLFLILISSNEGNRIFVALYFPVALGFGLVSGFVEGVVLGVCIKIRGHDLRWFTRAIIGALTFVVPYVALTIAFSPTSDLSTALTEDFMVLVIFSTAGAIFGIFTGSGLQVWSELVRGVGGGFPYSWFLTGLSGLILRPAIVLFFMESVLLVIALSVSRTRQTEFVIALLVLIHCVPAFVIAFARLRFWLLLPLALLINLPIAAYFADMLKEVHVSLFYVCMGYLGAWVAFLLARCPITYRALAVLKEEFKYYLID